MTTEVDTDRKQELPKNIVINEIPSIDDKQVLHIGLEVEKIRSIVHKLVMATIKVNKNIKISFGLIVAILDRQVELSLSILLLAIKGRVRDASILILNSLELRYDLEYISNDPQREIVWVEHTKENKKPWGVHEELLDVYTDKGDFEAEKSIYKQLSMVKHGNNAGNQISFGISIRDNRIILADPFIKQLSPLLAILGSSLYKSFKSSITILSNHGIEFKSLNDEMEETFERFDSANRKYLEESIWEYIYTQNPELKTLMDEKKQLIQKQEQLKSEIEDIKKRMDTLKST